MKSQDFARFPHWQSTFWQRVLLLTSGKHLPGITNAACSDPHHRPPFHCMWAPITVMWAPVPLHVGTDYAMWAAITVNLKMLPTSQRNRCPHHSVLGAHMPTESLPTSTGIRIISGVCRALVLSCSVTDALYRNRPLLQYRR